MIYLTQYKKNIMLSNNYLQLMPVQINIHKRRTLIKHLIYINRDSNNLGKIINIEYTEIIETIIFMI